MRKLFLSVLFCLAPATLNAQSDAPETIEFGGKSWRIDAQEVRAESHLGRNALFMKGGRIWLEGETFSDVVIEFDATFDERQAFIGPQWRANEQLTQFEELYFRPHQSGKPDAIQYTPVENDLSAWQIFSDLNATATAEFNHGEWNRFKVVVKGDKADFYVNGGKPQLHIPDLKTDRANGKVGLRVSGPVGEAHLSNISVRPLTASDEIIGTPKAPPAELPEGLITTWNVSTPFAEADFATALTLDDPTSGLKWNELETETNGIANLAKLATADDNSDTVFVRLKIKADRAMMKELRFGYSDRVRIYLNGKRVYHGVATWTARDFRFLGTVGFFDSVGLDLKRGDNEVLVAVSETFGGWAWAGAIEDQSGIKVSN